MPGKGSPERLPSCRDVWYKKLQKSGKFMKKGVDICLPK